MARVRATADRAAAMVEHDGCVRAGRRRRRQFGNLRMVEPGVERETRLSHPGETLAKGGVGHQMCRRGTARVEKTRIGIPGRDVADAAEAAVAGMDMGLKHLVDFI